MHTLVLFDIDGTLLSSSSAGRRAIERAFAAEFDDLSFFEQVRFDGKTYAAAVRFDLGSVPRGAQLQEAALRLHGLRDDPRVRVAQLGRLARIALGEPVRLGPLEQLSRRGIGIPFPIRVQYNRRDRPR